MTQKRSTSLTAALAGLAIAGTFGNALAVPEFDDAVRHKQVYRDEHDCCDIQRDVDGEVDHAPVRGQRCKRPGTKNVKENRTDNEQDQDNS